MIVWFRLIIDNTIAKFIQLNKYFNEKFNYRYIYIKLCISNIIKDDQSLHFLN